FFQAEDGIRDRNVTGVQTCALPIFEDAVGIDAVRQFGHDGDLSRTGRTVGLRRCRLRPRLRDRRARARQSPRLRAPTAPYGAERSEERRVGRECSCGEAAAAWEREV